MKEISACTAMALVSAVIAVSTIFVGSLAYWLVTTW